MTVLGETILHGVVIAHNKGPLTNDEPVQIASCWERYRKGPYHHVESWRHKCAPKFQGSIRVGTRYLHHGPSWYVQSYEEQQAT